MKLYFSPGACSMAPHIVANELGLNVEFVQVNLRTHQVAGNDYYQINPKGSVPALELDNGEVLTEAAVIMQYLADSKPGTTLAPSLGTWPRYRLMEWMNYLSTEIHKGFGPLWGSSTPEDMKQRTRETLEKKFSFLSRHLSRNEYMMGSQFSIADAYLFTLLNWTKILKMDLTKFPPLMGFMERIRNREAVVKTLKEEGLLH